MIDELVVRVERKVKRLTAAFADEPNEVVAAAYQAELKSAARERAALVAERAGNEATIVAGRLTASDRQTVLSMASEIRGKLDTPTFEQKRSLLNLLDVRVELTRNGDERCLKVTCGMILTPNGTPEQILMKLSSLEVKSLSTMMT